VIVVVEFTGELRKQKQLTAAARLSRTAAAVVSREEDLPGQAASILDFDASRAEFEELARSAGATIAATLVQRRQRPDPSSLVGQGKLDEIVTVGPAPMRRLFSSTTTCSPSIRSSQDEFSVNRLSAIKKAVRCDSVRWLSRMAGTVSHPSLRAARSRP
jgi:GTP-binding GTPase N-terminal